MITPIILAIVIRMLNPKVRTRIPKFNTMGSLRPKDWPKFSQESPDIPAAISPINPPKTIPESSIKRRTQEFLLFIISSPFPICRRQPDPGSDGRIIPYFKSGVKRRLLI